MRQHADQQFHASPGGPSGGDASVGKPVPPPKPAQSVRRSVAKPPASDVHPTTNAGSSQRTPSVSRRNPRISGTSGSHQQSPASPMPAPVATFQHPSRMTPFRKRISIRMKVVVAMAVLSGVVTVGTILLVYGILSANLESEVNRSGSSQAHYVRMLGGRYTDEVLKENNLVQLVNDVRAGVAKDDRGADTDKRSINAIARAWKDIGLYTGYQKWEKDPREGLKYYHPAMSYRSFDEIEQDFRWLLLANEMRDSLVLAETPERGTEIEEAMKVSLGHDVLELAGKSNRIPNRVSSVPKIVPNGDGEKRDKEIRDAVNALALALVNYRKLNWNDTLETLMGRVGSDLVYGISYEPGNRELSTLRTRFSDHPELSLKQTYSISATRGGFHATVENIPAYEAVQYDEGEIAIGQDVIPARRYRMPGDTGEQATIVASTTEIEETQRQILLSIVLISIGAIGLTGTLAWLVGTGITKPIANLMKDVTRIAGGDFDHRPSITSNDEVGLLAKLTGEMAGSLRVGKELWHETQERRHDISMAREIQENLLPSDVPEIPGYDIAAYYSPSKEVGGDYYDFFHADDQHLGCAIADVSGKGLPGSMVMMMAKALITQQSEQTLSPRELFINVNHVLAPNIKRGMFVTAYYAVLDRGMRTLTVASAGHNPMLIYRSGTDEMLSINPGGIALGFDRQGTLFARNIKEQEIQLQSGDRVLLYTDGLIEATNRAGDEFGEERLKHIVRAMGTIPSNDFMVRLLQEVETFKSQDVQHDDVTILTILVE